jgi:hypothetical protein
MRWNPLVFIATIVCAGGVLAGVVPQWSLVLVVALVWMPVLSARFGVAFAVAIGLVFTLWGILCIELLAQPLHLPVHWLTVVFGVIAGTGAFLSARRDRITLPPVSWPRLVTLFTVLSGSIVWGATVLIARLSPSGARVSWVMLGDSANNILMARDMIADGGIKLGPDANPVPLASGLLALFMREDRATDGTLLHSDLVGLALLWSALIMVLSILIALLARLVLRRMGVGGWVGHVLTVGASLVPLTWLVSGYPLEYGFLNAEVALVVLLATALIALHADHHPGVSLGVLSLSITLMLATWSPVALIPAAWAALVVVRRWKTLTGIRGMGLVWLLLSFAQLIAYVLIATLPSYLSQSSALSAAGGVFPFPWQMFAGLSLGAIAGVLAVTRSLRALDTWIVVTTVLASGAGLGFFLFLNRSLANPWTYYPLKFLWIASVVVGILAFVYILAFLATYPRLGFVTMFAVSAIALGLPQGAGQSGSSIPFSVTASPVYRVVAGNYFGSGDSLVNEILDTRSGGELEFFWKSANPNEGGINFWVLQDYANTLRPPGHEFRVYAYASYDATSTSTVCTLARMNSGRLIVHTAEGGLAGELAGQCPDMSITVVQG